MAYNRQGGIVAPPKWLKQLVADLDRHEGYREYAYPDPLSKIGKTFPANKYGWGFKPGDVLLASLSLLEKDGRPWTVGHGFTKGIVPATRMYKQASNQRLTEEALSHAAELDSLLPKWRTNFPLYAQTVFANLIYNMGRERLSKFTNTLALANAFKFAEAGVNLRKSLWYTQVGSRARELVKRLETGQIAPAHVV